MYAALTATHLDWTKREVYTDPKAYLTAPTWDWQVLVTDHMGQFSKLILVKNSETIEQVTYVVSHIIEAGERIDAIKKVTASADDE